MRMGAPGVVFFARGVGVEVETPGARGASGKAFALASPLRSGSLAYTRSGSV
jgi:hypothetical protein